MQEFFKKLRAKPEKVRQRILIGTLIVLVPFVLILVLSISSIYPKKTSKNGEDTIGIAKSLFNAMFSETTPLND